MRSHPFATRRLGGALAAVLLLSLPSTASAADTTPGMVTVAGLQVGVPRPGLALSVAALTSDGTVIDLVIETDASGATWIMDSGAPVARARETTGGDSVASLLGPCKDGGYNHRMPFRWARTWSWWFNAASTPAEITKRGAQAHLGSAVRSITEERNNCGRPDRVSARASYRGRTAAHPMVRPDGGCGGTDGKNVVGFGRLPMTVVGLTCTTYTVPRTGPGQAIESDVLLNKALYDWTTSSQSRCRAISQATGTFPMIVRSVATHEFGHVFGLDHVDEATHPALTMSTSLGPCDDSAFTLGLGDMRALEARY